VLDKDVRAPRKTLQRIDLRRSADLGV